MRKIEKSKNTMMMIAILVATTSIISSCGKAETTHELVPTQSEEVVEVFKGESEVNKDKWYSNLNNDEKYQVALEGLTPIKNKIYKRTGHKIYKDDTDTLYIISAFNRVPLALADSETLFSEKDASKIYLAETTTEKNDIIANMEVVDKIKSKGYTKIDNEDFNVILNYKRYNIENLIKEDDKGIIFVNVRPLWEQAHLPIIFEPSYTGFTLFRNELQDKESSVTSIMSRDFNKTYISEDGTLYAENIYDPKTFAVWIQLDSLRSVFGFETLYIDKEQLLVLKTDDIYDLKEDKTNVIALEDLRSEEEPTIQTGSETQTEYTNKLNAEIKAKEKEEEEEANKAEEQQTEKPVEEPIITEPESDANDNGYNTEDPNYGNNKSLTPTYPAPNDGKEYIWAPGQGWLDASDMMGGSCTGEDHSIGGGDPDPNFTLG